MMKTARPNKPFYVEEMIKEDFKDFKETIGKKVNKSSKYFDGQRVEVRKVHWIHIDNDKAFNCDGSLHSQ